MRAYAVLAGGSYELGEILGGKFAHGGSNKFMFYNLLFGLSLVLSNRTQAV